MNLFIHLRSKSDYSLLFSSIKPKKLVELALKNSIPALTLADSNNLCGALEFANECSKSGIQPIIGLDLEVEILLTNVNELKSSNILLIAQNEIGYKNLLQLNKLFYEAKLAKKNLNYLVLEQYNEGLILLTGFINGIITTALQDNYQSIVDNLKKFFPNRLYIELQRIDHNRAIEESLIKIAYDENLPIVATNNILFAQKSSHKAHDALICIKDSTYVSVGERKKFNEEHYFKSAVQMCNLFADLPEAIENTINIARRCSFKPSNRPPALPKYSDDEVNEMNLAANEGLQRKFADGFIKGNTQVYQERLDFELSVINKMGFAGYFLIVADFINWSRSQDIPVGPGRGSAAGSLVAWVMGITDVDPIIFGLLFERFLNPARISMPDIDVDFCPAGRDKVIGYIKEKYGTDSVAHIMTFGALQAKAVLRDVGRVLGLPYSQVDAICKVIPFNPTAPVTLQEAIDLDENLRNQAESDEAVKTLLDIGLELEGMLRNQSTHAAGVVISDQPLHTIIPVCYDLQNGTCVTQFHMKPLEQSGLVKFDFLGLTTLTLIHKTLALIKQNHGLTIDMSKLTLDDKATYDMLSTGAAVGIFQLESGIMREGLKKILPNCIEDIIALLSLNRPGPMENVPDYIARKFGRKEIDYLHPSLEKLLTETFGIIVYQEQVMEIAKILAGYSLGDADILRRAMGKKIKEEMDEQKEFFVLGAIKKSNLNRIRASFIFDLVAKFAGYGFNKSHATAYGIISYHTAWLKTHYKLEFLTSIMNLEMGDTNKLAILNADANSADIQILPPCINYSFAEFASEDGSIRYGLNALKNVGANIAQQIALNRVENGPFLNISNFLSRFDNRILNKKSLEGLIKSGAMNCLLNDEINQASLFGAVEQMIQYISGTTNSQNQLNLFAAGEIEFDVPIVKEWDDSQKMQAEFESIGFYLTQNPLSSYQDFLQSRYVISSDAAGSLADKQVVNMAGVITILRIRSSKRGKFANITIADLDGMIELFIFDSELVQNNYEILKEGKLIFFTMKTMIEKDGNGMRQVITALFDLDKIANNQQGIFEIEIDNNLNVKELSNLLGEKNKGNIRYLLVYYRDNYKVEIKIQGEYKLVRDINQFELINGVKRIKKIL